MTFSDTSAILNGLDTKSMVDSQNARTEGLKQRINALKSKDTTGQKGETGPVGYKGEKGYKGSSGTKGNKGMSTKLLKRSLNNIRFKNLSDCDTYHFLMIS